MTTPTDPLLPDDIRAAAEIYECLASRDPGLAARALRLRTYASSLVVVEPPKPVPFVISPQSLTIKPGQTSILAAAGGTVPPNAPLQWKSSTPAVAQIETWTGKVTAGAPGAASINVTAQAAGYPGARSTVLVTPHKDLPAPLVPRLSRDVDAVQQLLGWSPPVSGVVAQGGYFAKYESTFRDGAELHWRLEGAGNASYDITGVNYYDRASIYYAWWARTGNETYRQRADAIAVAYRTYVLTQVYRDDNDIQAHNAQPDGLAVHYALTGDKDTARALTGIADEYADARWFVMLDSQASGSHREQARIMLSWLLAWRCGLPSARGHDWVQWLRLALDKVLAMQGTDGAWRFSGMYAGAVSPFMLGLLGDMLTRYHDMFEPDPRIVPALRRAFDHMWATCWMTDAIVPKTGETFPTVAYVEYTTEGIANRSPAWDNANMVTSTLAWLARQTGDMSYMTKADAAFASVEWSYWSGWKQFNQLFTSSHRYLGHRFR